MVFTLLVLVEYMDSCSSGGTAYRHGKTYEECKQMAEDFTAELKPEIEKNGNLLWSDLLEKVRHDELVYKLTLKYLRRDGFDIGNNKMPEIKKIC
jgi:predicted RNase H-like HicB family nuclease